MAERTLIQRFGPKPGHKMLVLNAPSGKRGQAHEYEVAPNTQWGALMYTGIVTQAADRPSA